MELYDCNIQRCKQRLVETGQKVNKTRSGVLVVYSAALQQILAGLGVLPLDKKGYMENAGFVQ